MNILGNNASKLNAVIFENRNKRYGAYAIRESYNESLMKSLLCLGSIVVLVFGSAYAYNKANLAPATEKMIVLDDPNTEILEYREIDNTPLPKPVEHVAAAVAPSGAATSTVISDEAPTTNSVTVENTVTGVGSATATGTAPEGVESGTNVAVIHVEHTAPVEPVEVVIAEEMPEFEGGVTGLMRYVMQNISYPELARQIGKEGTVYVSFVVNEFGSVEGTKVVKGIGYGCDEEVVRVISKMPRWKKAGKNGGHPVKVRFNIPVSFKIK